MVSEEHVGQQFTHAQFHGTVSDIADRVLPAEQAGHQMWKGYKTSGGRSAKTVAFSTEGEHTAWRFADQAADNTTRQEHDRRWVASGRSPDYDRHVVRPRGRVYEVAPHPDQEPGLLNAQHPNWKRNSQDGRENLHEYIAPHFDVLTRHDIKPGHQGTFPQVNWNQFHVHGGGPMADANHPTSTDVESGHLGSSMYTDHLKRLYGDVDDHDPLGSIQRRRAQQSAEDAETARTQGKLF